MSVTIIDGPMGTLLYRRGVQTPPPGWSASALNTAPEAIADIHAEYAAAGATVHTANTFRTTQRAMGVGWEKLATIAVEIARDAVPPDHLVADSIAPLEDCYRPDLSPSSPHKEHALLADVLAAAGCDVLLCETFPHIDEGLAAARAAVSTGVETWLSFTAGFRGDLLTPAQVGLGAAQAVDLGVKGLLINCVPVDQTLPYVQVLAGLGVACGAYANSGHPTDDLGWNDDASGIQSYVNHAVDWVNAGASIVGACCGADPGTVEAISTRLNGASP